MSTKYSFTEYLSYITKTIFHFFLLSYFFPVRMSQNSFLFFKVFLGNFVVDVLLLIRRYSFLPALDFLIRLFRSDTFNPAGRPQAVEGIHTKFVQCYSSYTCNRAIFT